MSPARIRTLSLLIARFLDSADLQAFPPSRRPDSNRGPLHYESFRGCLRGSRSPALIGTFSLLINLFVARVVGLGETGVDPV